MREDETSASTEQADAQRRIGVSARRSRLPKALRLYERLGVPTPAEVDGSSGYRGYRESQLATPRSVQHRHRPRRAKTPASPGREPAHRDAYVRITRRRSRFPGFRRRTTRSRSG